MRLVSQVEPAQAPSPGEVCGCGHQHSRSSFQLGRGALNSSAPVALAISAFFTSTHHQDAGIVTFFMLLGQNVETRTAEGAPTSIYSLIKLMPSKARRIPDAREEEVPAQKLAMGDRIRLRPGDHVAADGRRVSGRGTLTEATVTNESWPPDKGKGDEVFAGTVDLIGVLEARVSKAGEDSMLSRVRGLIPAAEKAKMPLTRILDGAVPSVVTQAIRPAPCPGKEHAWKPS
jgi:cation transport ATPase